VSTGAAHGERRPWLTAAGLAAWTRLPGRRDDPPLRGAVPETLRHRIWHIPARLARHARGRALKISPGWP
jgi:hypothetical protein